MGDFTDTQLTRALQDCRLPQLISRLDEVATWDRQLSPGEQQRLAFARAILNAPTWLFLDEATASLDEATGSALYALLIERLPHSALISIAHDAYLSRFHSRHIRLHPGEHGAILTETVA